MKKAFLATLCLLFLCGCNYRDEDLSFRVLTLLQNLQEKEKPTATNMHKLYYNYYLPPSVGRLQSSSLSEVFYKDGYHMIMNFDPSSIVISELYQEQEETDLEIQAPTYESNAETYVFEGHYQTLQQEVFSYQLQLIKENDQYILYFNGDIVKFYAVVPGAEVYPMLDAMVLIASSLQYDDAQILKDFTLKNIEAEKQKSFDYLESNLPSAGSLQDLLYGETENAENGDSTQ